MRQEKKQKKSKNQKPSDKAAKQKRRSSMQDVTMEELKELIESVPENTIIRVVLDEGNEDEQ